MGIRFGIDLQCPWLVVRGNQGTIKIPSCSKAVSTEHALNLAPLHRQWWRLYRNELFSTETKNNEQSSNKNALIFKWSFHLWTECWYCNKTIKIRSTYFCFMLTVWNVETWQKDDVIIHVNVKCFTIPFYMLSFPLCSHLTWKVAYWHIDIELEITEIPLIVKKRLKYVFNHLINYRWNLISFFKSRCYMIVWNTNNQSSKPFS